MASLFSEEENRNLNMLAARRLIGTARADISCLEFFQGRQTDHHVVQTLLTVFSQAGCLRHDPDNYVPVLITKGNLRKALRASGLSQSALRNTARETPLCFLKVAKNQMLSCAHGRQRKEAAKSFFAEQQDRWWIIKVFLVNPDGAKSARFDRGHS